MKRRRSVKLRHTLISIAALAFITACPATAQINHHPEERMIHVVTEDTRLALQIDYSQGCKVSELQVNGKNVMASLGAFTAVHLADRQFSSQTGGQPIEVTAQGNEICLEGIALGDISESWRFKVDGDKVYWTISRTYARDAVLENMAMPVWHFADMKTWKGGILDNGGMVWSKYLSSPRDTYGVHTGGVTFWNEDQAHGLKLTVHDGDGNHMAATYSQSEEGTFACTHMVTHEELAQRYQLSRFVRGKDDVFAPFEVKRGKTQVTYELACVDYLTTYDRGSLPGIDAAAVRELLNTTARYGVVDNRIVGANGWITNWKCLHEPFFALIGLALNDPNYTDNLSATLDQERDLAMLEDGRVLSRWHDAVGDEIPGTYDAKTGYYEAMWGYTVDSQTGYVINTAEQFQQTADITWLRAHKSSCERALDWLIRRDSNGNGIFEMVNRNVAEQQASDWIDIVWASFENAFVNAQLYEALNQWAECEDVLGDSEKSDYYRGVAFRLKEAFNRPVDSGGFWSPDKKQYVYWRDDDGTVRGDNLVTPVNFAAIAFGLCDDSERVASILENIERRMRQENLFHWPLCFDSFKREEVHDNNWPFPTYENGDIFPTWGYLGIRSYIQFDKELAVKYIKNILSQYRKDGLSSQRYSRTTQKGLGTDILSGISTTIAALYSDVYGVRPKWNRMGLEPNMVPALNGTRFSYTLRDTVYECLLQVGDYQLKTADFHVRSTDAFGASGSNGDLAYYPKNKDDVKLVIQAETGAFIDLTVDQWNNRHVSWSVEGVKSGRWSIIGFTPGSRYELSVNGTTHELVVPPDGSLDFTGNFSPSAVFDLRLK
ncbi:hypothetical protein [Parapedobacter sp. 2B3]|uniref:alpha-L-rhamnosidase-related protein n=1 Tax=Parapedobacter sp. 2B3 TaxID=3342381 RepID=UPI0035B610B9